MGYPLTKEGRAQRQREMRYCSQMFTALIDAEKMIDELLEGGLPDATRVRAIRDIVAKVRGKSTPRPEK